MRERDNNILKFYRTKWQNLEDVYLINPHESAEDQKQKEKHKQDVDGKLSFTWNRTKRKTAVNINIGDKLSLRRNSLAVVRETANLDILNSDIQINRKSSSKILDNKEYLTVIHINGPLGQVIAES